MTKVSTKTKSDSDDEVFISKLKNRVFSKINNKKRNNNELVKDLDKKENLNKKIRKIKRVVKLNNDSTIIKYPERKVDDKKTDSGIAKVFSTILADDENKILSKDKELKPTLKENEKEELKIKKIKKKIIEFHSKPRPIKSTPEDEKNYRVIATYGVVQLFSAIDKHQKNISKEMKQKEGEASKKYIMETTGSSKSFMDILQKEGENVKNVSMCHDIENTEDSQTKKRKRHEGDIKRRVADPFLVDWDKKE